MTNPKGVLEWYERQEQRISIGKTCQVCGNVFPISSMYDTRTICQDCADALKVLVDIVKKHKKQQGIMRRNLDDREEAGYSQDIPKQETLQGGCEAVHD